MLYEHIFKKNKRYIGIPNTPIHISITNCKILNVIDLQEDKVMLEVFVEQQDIKEKLENVDEACKEAIIMNNNKWFKNDLSRDDILRKFEPCFDSQTSKMVIIIYKAYLKGFDRNDVSEEMTLNFQIKLLGLFINRDTFGNRWMVTSINGKQYLDQEENEDGEDGEDGVGEDGEDGVVKEDLKEDVYEAWLEEIDELTEKIQERKVWMDKQMDNFNEQLVKSKTSNRWNNDLDDLRTKLNKFHNFLSSI